MRTCPVWLTLCAAAALLANGCSSTPTEVNGGAIKARSFRFVATRQNLPAFAEREQQLHSRIQHAITQALATRQVTPAEQDADITVAYMVIVGNGAATTSIDDYFGYGRDGSKLVDKAHSKYISSKNPDYFEAGTLVVDIIDTRTFKLLHRGHVTRAIQANLTPEQREARVQAAVEEIFSKVHFKP